MNNKISFLLFASFTLLLAYLTLVYEPADVAKGGQIVRTVNILGTGTSTAGTTNFGALSTTTSSVIIVGREIDTVDFDIYPESASSTAHVGIQVLKTSLDRCGASGADLQDYVDAVSTNAVSTHLTTITSATSTIVWVPGTGETGKKFAITNFNAYCMKVFVGAQDVNLYIQGILKTNSF